MATRTVAVRPEARSEVPPPAGDRGNPDSSPTLAGPGSLGWALVIASLTTFVGVIGANIAAGVNADRLERLSALAAAAVGAVLVARFAVRIILGYANWFGDRRQGWDLPERRRLRYYTFVDAVLCAALLRLGLLFLADHGGVPQLLILTLVALAILILSGRTRRLVKRGGPPPLATVAEKWTWIGDLTAGAFSSHHARRVALVMVVALWFSFLVQGTALGLRLIAGSGAPPPVATQPLEPDPNQGAGQEESASGGETEDPPPSSLTHLCGVQIHAGDGLPSELREEFRTAWKELSPADGCPGIAKLVGKRTYAADGRCGDELRALGIVSPYHDAAVLLEGAADVARQLMRQRPLLGASPRKDMGGGDFHLLYTEAGPYLAIREEKTDGHGGTNRAPQTCSEIEPGGAPYELLPPGIAELLVRFDEEVVPSWPRREPARDHDDREAFSFHTPDYVEVARAWCSSPVDCELRSGAYRIHTTPLGPRTVSVARLRSSGPQV